MQVLALDMETLLGKRPFPVEPTPLDRSIEENESKEK
jgi:hypothetical protein